MTASAIVHASYVLLLGMVCIALAIYRLARAVERISQPDWPNEIEG